MQPRVETVLWDIVESCNDLLDLTDKKTASDFDDDRNLKHLVERKFEIIGEALRRVESMDPITFARVSGARGFINLRNVIAHRYTDVISVTLIRTCVEEIPVLRGEVLTLLGEPPDPEQPETA